MIARLRALLSRRPAPVHPAVAVAGSPEHRAALASWTPDGAGCAYAEAVARGWWPVVSTVDALREDIDRPIPLWPVLSDSDAAFLAGAGVTW